MNNRPTKQQVEKAHDILKREKEYTEASKAAERARHVGKCFRFRNSYGGSDRWWMYGIITHIDTMNNLRGWTIQHTPHNVIELDTNARCNISDNMEFITKNEFNEAVRDFYTTITDQIAECME